MHKLVRCPTLFVSQEIKYANLNASSIYFQTFFLPNYSSHTMLLDLTQPVTEMTIRNIPLE
jgi:hypothetical protein